jgi:nitrilase
MATEHTKVASIQLATGSNLPANLIETERLVEEAARAGARLVVLPENFAYLGATCAELAQVREPAGDGPLQKFLSQLADRLNIWLVGGTVPLTTGDGGKVRSAALLFDDQGELRARYDKMHLFDVHLVEADERYSESEAIEPGDAPCVIDTPFGRLGITICYDLRFPELFRAMLDQGMELCAMPSAFTAITGRAHWESLVRARAIENLCYIIAAAQGGFHVSGRETHGHSMIVDPWGTVLAQRARGGGVVLAEVDLGFLGSIRRSFPSIEHRRLHCR